MSSEPIGRLGGSALVPQSWGRHRRRPNGAVSAQHVSSHALAVDSLHREHRRDPFLVSSARDRFAPGVGGPGRDHSGGKQEDAAGQQGDVEARGEGGGSGRVQR